MTRVIKYELDGKGQNKIKRSTNEDRWNSNISRIEHKYRNKREWTEYKKRYINKNRGK